MFANDIRMLFGMFAQNGPQPFILNHVKLHYDLLSVETHSMVNSASLFAIHNFARKGAGPMIFLISLAKS